MIDPFDLNAIEKPATYLVPLEGPARFLGRDGSRQSFFLSDHHVQGEQDIRNELELFPNSLCYITLLPTFRIPAYLAGRFNLQIKDIYRGLLVGTGPLVDPGFVGRISIPVHNLTSSSYFLRAGEGFVYFEFTELSWVNASASIPSWVPPQIDDQPPFPASKRKRKTLDDYLDQATGGGPAQNAIQQDIKKVTEIANSANRLVNLVSVGSVVAAILFLITVLGTTVGAWHLYLGSQQFTQDARGDLLAPLDDMRREIAQMHSQIEALERSLAQENEVQEEPSP